MTDNYNLLGIATIVLVFGFLIVGTYWYANWLDKRHYKDKL